MVEKAPDAFRTISEVADDLRLPQHVLRFWESRFAQIKPMKRAGGRRYYRPDDVDLLRGIHHLLYGEGYTIRGAQRVLREQGVKFVQIVWQPGAAQPPHSAEDEESAHEPGAGAPDSSAKPKRPRADNADVGEAAPPLAVSTTANSVSLLGPASDGTLSREGLRKLQAVLFELGECRRLLDDAQTDQGR